MTIFLASLNQIAFLFSFIVLGYILSKGKFVPDNTQAILSKLENLVFIPALVLGTFISNFTVQTLSVAWRVLLGSLMLSVIAIFVSLLCSRFCSKDPYERNIYTYGLAFSNFSFMGNAVVSALFPEIFLEYLIFTLVLWTVIYLWGAPALLMSDGGKQSLKQRLKSFVNPMFVCTLLGMVIGLTGITVPSFLSQAIDATSKCMSPVAMLLTGMTIAQLDLKQVLRIKNVYVVSFLRLVVYPLAFLAVLLVWDLPKTFAICALCSLAMPTGLNTIIVPAALGKDTTIASGMALVSHVLSCVTIPLIFMLFSYITG